MSREEKINKMIEEIKIRRNDEQYKGGPFPIYHIEFDILNEEIERLNNIVKRLGDRLEKQRNNELEKLAMKGARLGIPSHSLNKLQELKGSDKK